MKRLKLFCEAGVGRETAWEWASSAAAEVLRVEPVNLAEGGPAELIVSPVSPYAPHWDPLSISATICGGTCLMATDLDASIRRENARFEGLVGDHLARWMAKFALNRAARRFVN